MDMCHPCFALIPGHTLKIESQTRGPENAAELWNVIPTPDCGNTCKEEGRCVCAFSECVCVHLPVHEWPLEHSGDIAALSQQCIPGENCPCLPCLMLHTVNSH